MKNKNGRYASISVILSAKYLCLAFLFLRASPLHSHQGPSPMQALSTSPSSPPSNLCIVAMATACIVNKTLDTKTASLARILIRIVVRGLDRGASLLSGLGSGC